MRQEVQTKIQGSLSARLLILTIMFILLAEAFIYVPSIARYRMVYLKDHLETAHLAILALEAAPDRMVDDRLKYKLLEHAQSYGVVLRDENRRMLIFSDDMPDRIDHAVNLQEDKWGPLIMEAFSTMAQDQNRILRVVGPSPRMPDIIIEVILDEAPLRSEMAQYSKRILNLSLGISLFAAILIYISLQWMMVRPIRRLANNMSCFQNDPEDEAQVIQPSQREDEIGFAENQLKSMQIEIREMLRQKERLATIGTAVAKINHDLRNSLSRAMLVSDQLAGSSDEKVQKLAPQLSQSVDQAIDLCSQTMDYVSNSSPHMNMELFYVYDLIDEVIEFTDDLVDDCDGVLNHVDSMAQALGDVTQLRRVLVNLCRNALQMGSTTVTISTEKTENECIAIDVTDNGPGMPDVARENLFKPFKGSARRGGTGLGLVIARDIMRAHDGDLILVHTGIKGTCFRLKLPQSSS